MFCLLFHCNRLGSDGKSVAHENEKEAKQQQAVYSVQDILRSFIQEYIIGTNQQDNRRKYAEWYLFSKCIAGETVQVRNEAGAAEQEELLRDTGLKNGSGGKKA